MKRLALILALCTTPAAAHQAIPTAAAPLGWAYPLTCCSNQDCRETANVKETPAGYQVPSGEVVGYGDTRVKDSPDGEFHWCSVYGTDKGSTICLFVPSRGY